jgi:hypothetical protein
MRCAGGWPNWLAKQNLRASGEGWPVRQGAKLFDRAGPAVIGAAAALVTRVAFCLWADRMMFDGND